MLPGSEKESNQGFLFLTHHGILPFGVETIDVERSILCQLLCSWVVWMKKKYHPCKLHILNQEMRFLTLFLGSKMANILGCHVGDGGSIPCWGTTHYEEDFISSAHCFRANKMPSSTSQVSVNKNTRELWYTQWLSISRCLESQPKENHCSYERTCTCPAKQLADRMWTFSFTSTDGSNDDKSKQFPIVIRTLNSGLVSSEFLSVPICEGSATGEIILKLLEAELMYRNVPWTNCLTVGCENAQVMTGNKKGVIALCI